MSSQSFHLPEREPRRAAVVTCQSPQGFRPRHGEAAIEGRAARELKAEGHGGARLTGNVASARLNVSHLFELLRNGLECHPAAQAQRDASGNRLKGAHDARRGQHATEQRIRERLFFVWHQDASAVFIDGSFDGPCPGVTHLPMRHGERDLAMDRLDPVASKSDMGEACVAGDRGPYRSLRDRSDSGSPPRRTRGPMGATCCSQGVAGQPRPLHRVARRARSSDPYAPVCRSIAGASRSVAGRRRHAAPCMPRECQARGDESGPACRLRAASGATTRSTWSLRCRFGATFLDEAHGISEHAAGAGAPLEPGRPVDRATTPAEGPR